MMIRRTEPSDRPPEAVNSTADAKLEFTFTE